jgi:5-methylcytosine-specific restriction endonuclease McrA
LFKGLNLLLRQKGHRKYSVAEDVISDKLNRKYRSRRDYYNNVYLKSDAWQRKRYIVLKRDNYRCVYCGAHATQVHHKRYAPKNIGNEPIDWLVSVCKSCHDNLHH